MRFRIDAGRVLTVALSLAVAAAVVFYAVAYGPAPEPAVLIGPAPSEPTKRAPAVRVQAKRAAALIQPEMLLSMMGASRVMDREGCEAITPERFVDRLEAEYRAKGYHSSEAGLAGAKDKYDFSQLLKSWWRSGSDGAFVVGALGTSGSGSILEMTSATLEAGCGTRWKKYHYEMHPAGGAATRLAGGKGKDESGEYPLPSSADFLYSLPARSGSEMRFYSIAMEAESARQWFRAAMSRRWQDVNSAERTPSAQGMMYFTQADRYCMIFVGRGKSDNDSVAVVSVGRV